MISSSSGSVSSEVLTAPASVKSRTSSAPESFMSHASPPAPVPVILQAMALSPAARRPRTMLATTVVLPEFMLVPTTAMVGGRGTSRGGAPSA